MSIKFKIEKEYYVTYSYLHNGNWGKGNIDIQLSKPFPFIPRMREEDLVKTREHIQKNIKLHTAAEIHIDKIIIDNIIPFPL